MASATTCSPGGIKIQSLQVSRLKTAAGAFLTYTQALFNFVDSYQTLFTCVPQNLGSWLQSAGNLCGGALVAGPAAL